MKSENNSIKLGEFADVLGGYAFKSSMFSDFGIPVLKIKNVHQKFVDLTDMQCIDESLYDEKLQKYIVNDKDILIAMTGQGSVGRVGRVYLNRNKLILLNQRVGKIITDESKLDSNYLFYILSSERYREILFNSGSGSGQPNLSPTVIKSIEIPYVNIEKQRYIGSLLSLLDEKIRINTEMIHDLEELSQMIFKHWFVNYEFPNGKGQPYKSSGSKMVKSELGEIPELFTVDCLESLISETIGGDWGKEVPQGHHITEVSILRGADIPEVKIGKLGKVPIRYILEKNYINKKLTPGDVVIEISGGSPTQSTGRVTYINQEILERYNDLLLCTNFCRAMRPKTENTGLFIYMYFNYLYNEAIFFSYENGTTGIKNLDITSFLQSHKIAMPSGDIINKFNEEIEVYYRFIQELGNENIKIEKLRDSLLPKLLSGEIEIPIESVVK